MEGEPKAAAKLIESAQQLHIRRALALRESILEYAEYYFLFPLFVSITLLTSAGFFDAMQSLIRYGIETLGQAHVAFAQFR